MSSIHMESKLSSTRLTTQQLKHLRTELERERRWLTSTAALEWLGQPEPAASRSVDGARMSGRLNEVLEALDRLAGGTYGICNVCRSPISFQRLEVIPETTTCISCGRR